MQINRAHMHVKSYYYTIYAMNWWIFIQHQKHKLNNNQTKSNFLLIEKWLTHNNNHLLLIIHLLLLSSSFYQI